MPVDHVLTLLLSSLSTNNKLILSWAAISLWREDALNILLECQLIKPISNATNIQCMACENSCSIDVHPHQYPNKIKYYAVCDDPIMHEQMGRMTVPVEQLKQWQCSIKQLALVVAKLLDFSNNDFQNTMNKTRLGMLKTPKGRKWVSLLHDPLALEVNQELLPIAEVLFFEENKLFLDMDRVNAALLIVQPPEIKPYAPNCDKQTISKLNTQAMYQDWQDEYCKLKKDHPDKSISWRAKRIAKSPIAQGRDSETIRKMIKS